MGFFQDYFNFFGNAGKTIRDTVVPGEHKVINKLATQGGYRQQFLSGVKQGATFGKKPNGNSKKKGNGRGRRRR